VPNGKYDPSQRAERAACRSAEGPRAPRASPASYDRIPDVRDGLTRIERVILYELHKAQQQNGDRHVPTAMLYGRVVEHVNISVEEFQRVLARLVGK
jgi:hypothetical protein